MKSNETSASNVLVRRVGTAKLATSAFLLLSVGALFAFVAGALLGAPRFLEAPLGWTILLSPLAALISSGLGAMNFKAGSVVSIESGEVAIDGKKTTLRAEELANGWFSPSENRVYLQTKRGDEWSVPVGSAAEGQMLLEKAGLDASKRTWRTRLGPTDFLTAMTWLVGLPMSVSAAELIVRVSKVPSTMPLFFVVMPIAVVLFIVFSQTTSRLFGPANLIIGADGVAIKRGFSSDLVKFDEMEKVTIESSRVTFRLKNGKDVSARARHLGYQEQSTILERIEKARALHKDRAVEPASFALLDRGARTLAEWTEALGALLSNDSGYRNANLTREQVISVLENPAAPAERRIGAAITLAKINDGEAPLRTRIAAGASANPRVRIALEHIADGHLDEEDILLAAQEESQRERKQKR
ncbi:MAG: hypothetical protein IPK82_08775 [Polyangiaceae bacterium]|nr:hypothetical protein [Polyangiaceae bacterium]